MKPAAIAAAALLLSACAADLTSPFAAVAVTYDTAKHQYKLAQVQLTSLKSLRHLQGTAGTVLVGGQVRVQQAAVAQKGATVDALRQQFVAVQPGQVDLAWHVLNDIVYPENFDSLELLSAYYNLEKVRRAFSDWGLSQVPVRPIVAHASLLDDGGLSPLPQGELYYPPLATFYFPVPSTVDTQLPLVFNLGAMAHAVTHEAVAELVWGGTPVAAPELGPAHDPGWNSARHVARSMAEGLADYLGAAVSDDPRWFDHSEQQRATASALDTVRCSSPDMLQALPADDATVPYNPFPLGTVLAGSLQEASAAGVQVTAAGVLAALPEIASRAQAAGGKLVLAVVLDSLVHKAAPERKPDLCGLFANRFASMSIGSLPSCSGVTPTVHQECTQ